MCKIILIVLARCNYCVSAQKSDHDKQHLIKYVSGYNDVEGSVLCCHKFHVLRVNDRMRRTLVVQEVAFLALSMENIELWKTEPSWDKFKQSVVVALVA